MPEAVFDLDKISGRTAKILATSLVAERFTIVFLFQVSGYIINHSKYSCSAMLTSDIRIPRMIIMIQKVND
jgi:hypothetical protein